MAPVSCIIYFCFLDKHYILHDSIICFFAALIWCYIVYGTSFHYMNVYKNNNIENNCLDYIACVSYIYLLLIKLISSIAGMLKSIGGHADTNV